VWFGGPGAIGSWPSTDDADVTIHGDFPGEHAGWSVSAGGDVNGDGVNDLFVGAPYNNAEPGVPGIAYLFFGQPSWYGADDTGDADVALQGETGHTLVGNAVAVVPDLNGDGYDELLVGGEDADDGSGRAWLLYGHSMVWIDENLEDADAIFDADDGSGWGAALGGCGDLDGDGRGELWIGSRGHGDGGGVAVYFGTASLLSGTVDLPGDADTLFLGANDEEAAVLASPGDMDGDGSPEVAIGARSSDVMASDAGAVYLVTDDPGAWPDEVDLADAHSRLLGEVQGDWFGHGVAAGGDLDDDGLDDLLITAPYNDQAGSASGKVYVVYGY